MIVSLAWIDQQFNAFNEAYFKNQLPKPAFKLSSSLRVLGQFKCSKKRTLHGIVAQNCSIALTTAYEFTEKQAQEVLLHEMIHYVIAYNQWWEKRPHGVVFMRFLNHFNENYGWNLSVTERTNNLVLSAAAQAKKQKKAPFYLVLAIEKTSGECFLSVVNKRFATTLHTTLKVMKGIKSYKWYVSTDSFFSSFPVVRSLRGRKITKKMWQEKTNELLPYDALNVL